MPVNGRPNGALAAWLTFWRIWRRYHRYEVAGMEKLDGIGPALIVGYHGRPLAWDMCMLTVEIYDRYGYLPHGILHRGVEMQPRLKQLADALGFVTRDGPELEAAVRRGEHIIDTPGGGEEGARHNRHQYQVSWGRRLGYLRLALRHGLPVVPVGAAGADSTYIGLNDPEKTAERLGVPKPFAWATWVGVGLGGIYPFAPPLPVKMKQFIGDPIELGDIRADDLPALREAHERVTGAVQAILDQAVWQV
jgi:1-acyl-sn-glycerol-3-phosphate acyltransferase